ncbi:hypothetical protein [Zobellella endophytica]|uniref:hypothetical protein n=1 Tax=Zobellella endophytica TaxID=2116700 RepID=UPI001B30AC96|nr:hypothetical protein [Zobellella endophytica]
MLDTRVIPLPHRPLPLVGFMLGMLALPALWQQHYLLALGLILLNRLSDDLDNPKYGHKPLYYMAEIDRGNGDHRHFRAILPVCGAVWRPLPAHRSQPHLARLSPPETRLA